MRNSIYLLFLLLTVALASCKKDKVQQTIKQYDDAQIQAYIASKGYTGVKRDTIGGDTSGIYYQVLVAGKGAPVEDSTHISFTYTIQSLDGTYVVADTILNHSYTPVGGTTPPGLQLALHDLLKTMGTKLRLIIPSHLAYGTNGVGTGSTRLGGNQSLEYYINVINNVKSRNGITYTNTIDNYDDQSIQNYISANNLPGFNKITSGTYAGLYYKIRTPGTGLININSASVVNFDYRSQLLNGNVIEPANYSTTTNITASNTSYYMSNLNGQVLAIREGLLLGVSAGAQVTLIAPSRLAFGLPGTQGQYPAHSCVFYDITIDSVTN